MKCESGENYNKKKKWMKVRGDSFSEKGGLLKIVT